MNVYGSSLWELSCQKCERFYVAWRKCVRRILKVSNRTHCNLLTLICNDFPPKTQLSNRFLNFIRSALNSSLSVLLQCVSLAVNGSSSNVSKRISYVFSENLIDKSSLASPHRTRFINTDGQLFNTAKFITDFIALRDNSNAHDTKQLQAITDFVATN